MEKENGKKNLLRYFSIAVFTISFILVCWPNILGWNRNDIWLFNIPISYFCIYLFALLISLSLGGLYLADYKETKNKQLAKRIQNQKGGDK